MVTKNKIGKVWAKQFVICDGGEQTKLVTQQRDISHTQGTELSFLEAEIILLRSHKDSCSRAPSLLEICC